MQFSKKIAIPVGLLLTGILTLLYARYIEPQIITVRDIEVTTGFSSRFVLLSDLHLGIYKKGDFLVRVLEEVKTLNPEYVLIAGDLTLVHSAAELSGLFDAFKDFPIPVYAVLGNHDTEHPGPKIQKELVEELTKNNVKVLQNEQVSLGKIQLIGLGDHWSGADDVSLLKKVSAQDNVIVLTHNPDTTDQFPNSHADLTVTGHTHCGQIRIPFLYQFFIPTVGLYDSGLVKKPETQLIISCGVGESWPPMRLFNPPTIDLVELK